MARYHSLHGIEDSLPPCLKITAATDDGIVMGIQHDTLPYAAVQFHPESILTDPRNGMSILKNAIRYLRYDEQDEDGRDGDDGFMGPRSLLISKS